jgi:hypothetical protein
LPRELPLVGNSEVLIEWDPTPFEEGEAITVGAGNWLCNTRAWRGSLRLPFEASPSLPPGNVTLGFLTLQLGIERHKGDPILFPFQLSNGAWFNGIVQYRISEFRVIRIIRGPAQ